jgi:hypothetical protein
VLATGPCSFAGKRGCSTFPILSQKNVDKDAHILALSVAQTQGQCETELMKALGLVPVGSMHWRGGGRNPQVSAFCEIAAFINCWPGPWH